MTTAAQTLAPPDLAEADGLFIGEPTWHTVPVTDRHDYKKKAGSSDSQNTYDAIET